LEKRIAGDGWPSGSCLSGTDTELVLDAGVLKGKALVERLGVQAAICRS